MSELHERFSVNAHALLVSRLASASVVESFRHGEWDTNTLVLMQEADGRQFVQRTYRLGAELDFENAHNSPRLPFAEGVAAMQAMYESVGIRVASNSVLPQQEGEPATVITEYLPGAVQYNEATLEAKQEAVQGLIRLLEPNVLFLPGAEAVARDLFLYEVGEDGKQHPVVVDIEPYLRLKRSANNFISPKESDRMTGFYINQIATLIEFFWAKGNTEKVELFGTFLLALNTLSDGSMLEGDQTSQAIMGAHSKLQRAQLDL